MRTNDLRSTGLLLMPVHTGDGCAKYLIQAEFDLEAPSPAEARADAEIAIATLGFRATGLALTIIDPDGKRVA